MQGAELSSFHDGRFPIISLSMSFQSGRTMCFNLFANKFSEKSREISAPAISQGTQLSASSCDFDRNDSLTFYIRTSGSFAAVSTSIFVSKYLFSVVLISRPYRAKKKCEHFSSPEKKEHLAESPRLGRPSRRTRALWGLPTLYLLLTLGLRWAYLGLTLGNVPSHPRPILADFG